MSKNNRIPVNINKNSVSSTSNVAPKPKQNDSLDTSESPELPPPAPFNKYSKKRPLISEHSFIKRVIISASIAFIAGSFIGILLLRMFVGMTEGEAVNTNPNVTGTSNVAEEETATVSGSTDPSSVPSLEAHVVQLGVFSSRDKADEWKRDHYGDKSTFVWERDGQFFMFAQAAPNYGQAEAWAEEHLLSGQDYYIKHWQVEGENAVLSAPEQALMQDLQELWLSTLHGKEVNEDGEAVLDDFNQVDHEGFSDLEAAIQRVVEEPGDVSTVLNVGYEYEQAILASGE
ncbi:hypothetical protein [Thalassobacillus sp. CUG 92003]|uniref:hypothetical protein n=1 Tax=Thalassobacillus sp. CUG 92003 TaxID=2736641 RepID=UPI0015E63B95|nr:hypothetical protein [Thalassobacillus sp. CUG 92003]